MRHAELTQLAACWPLSGGSTSVRRLREALGQQLAREHPRGKPDAARQGDPASRISRWRRLAGWP